MLYLLKSLSTILGSAEPETKFSLTFFKVRGDFKIHNSIIG